MSTELTVQTGRDALNYNDASLLATIKATIAADATDDEFKMFVEFCKGTGLNPFKKEIWFIKTKEKRWYSQKEQKEIVIAPKVQMMTGIAGFYAIANSHPQYDGMEETVIERGPGGKILRATAKVWRKDRRFPSVGVAEWAEYAPADDSKSIWATKPSVMIAKVAESIALRKAFPNELNGLYTTEEMPKDYEPKDVTPTPPKLPTMIEDEDKETWYFLPKLKAETSTKLKLAGCEEYWKEELSSEGVTVELFGYWKSPKDLGAKFEKAKIQKPGDVLKVED